LQSKSQVGDSKVAGLVLGQRLFAGRLASQQRSPYLEGMKLRKMMVIGTILMVMFFST
jgi:hypothetical protein